MGLSDIFRSLRTIISLLVIFIIIVAIVTQFDLMSYTASGHQTLTPDGNVTGKALIVYDPGIMGMGTRSAHWMGDDLRTRGYSVNISGIRSPGIENATENEMVIVIGPTYFGGPTGPITSYLNSIQLKPDAIVGIYAVSGIQGDDAGMQMRTVLENRSVAVKSSGSVGAWDKDAEEKSYSFIFSLLR